MVPAEGPICTDLEEFGERRPIQVQQEDTCMSDDHTI